MAAAEICIPVYCGKAFRERLKRQSPNLPPGKVRRKPRYVPAFTIQAMQRGTVVYPAPKCDVFKPLALKETVFKQAYKRGEFPITMMYDNFGKHMAWKVPIERLDYSHYLPMFFDGLCEKEQPYKYFVQQGVKDMIEKGPQRVLAVLPQLIIPIKNALRTKRPDIMCHTLKTLQVIVKTCDRVGEALVPYYRQILPTLNLFREKNKNLGEGVDFTAAKGENVADLIQDTLQVLERYGGPDAFINIKYMVPTYESCVMN